MLFATQTTVDLPPDLDCQMRDDLLATEKAYSQELQRADNLLHLWRVVDEYSNLGVFDVSGNAESHDPSWNPAAVQVHARQRHAAGLASVRTDG
jgi:muconolactone D-isomerase